MQAALPGNEGARLAALLAYAIVDTEPEPAFDDLALLAAQICGTPIAAISLIDAKRQWFKAKIGITASEMPREIAFCAHGILQADLFVVPDAQNDPRFAENPLVAGASGIRFYAGSPLVTPDGHNLGMLCVIDRTPRDLTESQRSALRTLSRSVVSELDSRRRLAALQDKMVELKRARDELAWKTAFLEAKSNANIDGILVVDPHGKKISQNQRLAELFRIPAEILQDSDDRAQREWVAGMVDNPEEYLAKVSELQAHPTKISRDELKLKDGLTLDRYSAPVVGAAGEYFGRIWTFRDITASKAAGEKLRLLGLAVQQTNESITITNAILDAPGPQIVFVNPAFSEMTGYAVADVMGKSPRILQGPGTDRALLDRLRASLARGEEFQGETINYRKDGTPYDVEWHITPLRDPEGKVTNFVAIQHDISGRREVARALLESNEKFQQFAENITDAFWVRSPDMRKLHYLSPAFERIWGRTVASMYASPEAWIDLIVPEDRERVVAAFGALMGAASSLDIEYRIQRPSGDIRWVRVRAFQVRSAEDELIRHTGIVTDVTDQRRLEALLVQSQKMESVGKLAGGIAHEFNSLLTAIMGQSEMLLSDLPVGGALAKGATEISRAAMRAAALTRQLLAYSRKQIMRPEALDLNLVIARMRDVFPHLMGSAVETLVIPLEGLHSAIVDAGQIEQVIMNLALNARDAMPNGGKFTLETANVTLDQESVERYPELRPGEYVMLAVSDTGVGMTPDVKAHLFEPFFSTKGIGEGTGLGLSTCYGIVKQSGGSISFYSEVGRGTSFKIYLPCSGVPLKAPVAGAVATGLPRGSETILLVEDDPALREMAATLLRRLGYIVLAAANGIEALSLKQREGIGYVDLLFTDVAMPHMSGKELAERMRVSHPTMKILFASAYTENAIVQQGGLGPGAALLQKPFTPSVLAHKLRELLDGPATGDLTTVQDHFTFSGPPRDAISAGS